MKCRIAATEAFWRTFYSLPGRQKESTREAWKLFRNDPFHPLLRTHKIHRLSAIIGKTVHAVVIEGDLRAVFDLEDGTEITFKIRSHSIYRA